MIDIVGSIIVTFFVVFAIYGIYKGGDNMERKKKVYCRNCKWAYIQPVFPTECHVFNEYTETYIAYSKNVYNAQGDCQMFSLKEEQ